MDFARKQLEKFGWKEGSGLGKNNQGMLQAIKPSLKVGKEGMGYDFSKELVDTWWTRAYDDSLSRINVDTDAENSETVGVTLIDDEEEQKTTDVAERPFEKMRKRMMKATFTTFAKGATLSNGEMIVEPKLESDTDDSEAEDDAKAKQKSKEVKALTDEELFMACGGRTAHKAARFGLKLNGKLARIAAQEEAAKALLISSKSQNEKSSKNIVSKLDKPSVSDCPPSKSVDVLEDSNAVKSVRDKKKKKKKSKRECEENNEEDDEEQSGTISSQTVCAEGESGKLESPEELQDSKEKRKKHKKRKYKELDETFENVEIHSSLDLDVEAKISSNEDSTYKRSKKSKSKKLKLSRKNKSNEETCALLSTD